MHETTEQRVPGVRYRRAVRYRDETTVIDGIPSTRRVPYDTWEPVPPRDWDDVVLRGVATVAIAFTAVAVVTTTASVGKLLGPLVPGPVAYAGAALFPTAWVYFTAVEWLNRTAPHRAQPAQIGGWITLLLSMAAVVTYGYTLHTPWSGWFGAGIDLLAKTFCWMFLRQYAVPLDPGVAHWLDDQEQKLASRQLLATRLLRINRSAAYQQAIGGVEHQAAGAILAAAQTAPVELPGQRPDTTDTPVAEPVSAPAPQTTPAPQAPVSGQSSATVSAQVTPHPAGPVQPVSAPGQDTADTAGQGEPPVPPAGEQPPVPPAPPVTPIEGGSIAATIRQILATELQISDEALTEKVKAVHGDRPNLAETVRRTRARLIKKAS